MISSIPFLIPLFFSYSTAASSPPFFYFLPFLSHLLSISWIPFIPLFFFLVFSRRSLALSLLLSVLHISPSTSTCLPVSSYGYTLLSHIPVIYLFSYLCYVGYPPPPNTSCNLLRYISRVYHVLRPYVLCLVCFRFPYSPMLAAVRVLFFLISSLLSFLLFISGPRVSFVFLSIRLSGPEQGGKVSYWQS